MKNFINNLDINTRTSVIQSGPSISRENSEISHQRSIIISAHMFYFARLKLKITENTLFESVLQHARTEKFVSMVSGPLDYYRYASPPNWTLGTGLYLLRS